MNDPIFDKIVSDMNEDNKNLKFIKCMEQYIKSANSVPIERVMIKVTELRRLIELARKGSK